MCLFLLKGTLIFHKRAENLCSTFTIKPKGGGGEGGKSMMCYKDAKASEETDSLLLTD